MQKDKTDRGTGPTARPVLSRFTYAMLTGTLLVESPGVPFLFAGRAESIPVEPDPDHAGERKRGFPVSVSGVSETLFYWS